MKNHRRENEKWRRKSNEKEINKIEMKESWKGKKKNDDGGEGNYTEKKSLTKEKKIYFVNDFNKTWIK